jgi:hypothetical protein
MKEGIAFFVGFGMAALAALSICLILHYNSIQSIHAEAVKRGAAEWVVDQETGRTTFQWKPGPQ